MEKVYSLKKEEFKVLSKGRKHYHIKKENSWEEYKINISDLKHEYKDYSQRNKQFFRSLEEIEELEKLNELHKEIKNYFSYYSFPKLNLSQSERILNIIKENETNK